MTGSIWARPQVAAATGRPAEHGRPQITAAAVAVAEAEGLAAVTMRRVATELRTGAASLYRHLATRDDLLDLMIDHAWAGLDLPPGTGRAGLVEDQLATLAFLRERPWLVDALATRPATAQVGPHALARIERMLGRLADDPAPGWAKLDALGVLDGLVRARAQAERRGEPPEHLAATAVDMLWAASDGAHPHLVLALAATPPTRAAGDRLRRLLALVLDGLLAAEP